MAIEADIRIYVGYSNVAGVWVMCFWSRDDLADRHVVHFFKHQIHTSVWHHAVHYPGWLLHARRPLSVHCIHRKRLHAPQAQGSVASCCKCSYIQLSHNIMSMTRLISALLAGPPTQALACCRVFLVLQCRKQTLQGFNHSLYARLVKVWQSFDSIWRDRLDKKWCCLRERDW